MSLPRMHEKYEYEAFLPCLLHIDLLSLPLDRHGKDYAALPMLLLVALANVKKQNDDCDQLIVMV